MLAANRTLSGVATGTDSAALLFWSENSNDTVHVISYIMLSVMSGDPIYMQTG